MTYAQLSVNAREIVAKFTLATSQEVQLGCDWYRSALNIAGRIADRYDMRIETVAGVIAALSPNNRWERNIIDAEALIKVWAAGGSDADILAVKCCTYPLMRQKALDILKGSDIVKTLNGPKIIEVFICITNPMLNDLCIDGHAYSIWLGQRVVMKDVPNIKAKKRRSQIKTDYRDATAFINEELHASFTPADIQAITWVTHKRIHNV